jgi:putative hydrolase of the HAD superfamily
VRYLAGLKDMLASLSRRYKLAVVSNTDDTSLVPAHLNAMGVLEYFDAVILSVQIGWRKPHPAIFTATQETLGIGPGDALFVGDSYLPDYQGPSRAGITAFLIDPGHLAEVPDHARLASLFELPAALDSNRHLSTRAQITRSGSHLRPEPRPPAPTQTRGYERVPD